jgi:alcohol dehydrogenase
MTWHAFARPPQAYGRVLDLVRSGQLDLSAIRARVLPLTDLPEAMALAARAGNFECVVMRHGD